MLDEEAVYFFVKERGCLDSPIYLSLEAPFHELDQILLIEKAIRRGVVDRELIEFSVASDNDDIQVAQAVQFDSLLEEVPSAHALNIDSFLLLLDFLGQF